MERTPAERSTCTSQPQMVLPPTFGNRATRKMGLCSDPSGSSLTYQLRSGCSDSLPIKARAGFCRSPVEQSVLPRRADGDPSKEFRKVWKQLSGNRHLGLWGLHCQRFKSQPLSTAFKALSQVLMLSLLAQIETQKAPATPQMVQTPPCPSEYLRGSFFSSSSSTFF